MIPPCQKPGVGPPFDIRLVHGGSSARAGARAEHGEGPWCCAAIGCCWCTPASTAIHVPRWRRRGGECHGAAPWPVSCGKSAVPSCWRWGPAGQTREYRAAREADSRRLLHPDRPITLCRGGRVGASPVPAHEIRLGFTPGWFALEEALQTNKTQLAGPCPQWTVRETRVLARAAARWHESGLLA